MLLSRLTWLTLALGLLPMIACSQSGATEPPTPPNPQTVSYVEASTPQLQLTVGRHRVLVTALRDDLLHLAYSDNATPGTPYFSPLIVPQSFAGPSEHAWDAEHQRFTTRELAVEAQAGCWQISDRLRQRVLTRLCHDTWQADHLRLTLSAENHSEVLGLGQYLSSGKTRPSWLGEQRTTGDSFGNAMTYSDIMASGNTQVPVAYVLGEGQNNYGLFFDTPYALQFDFRNTNWTVDSNEGQLGLFVFSGPDLQDLRHDYLGLTGTAPVPPLKAFGLWISEYGYDNWAELDDKLASLLAKGFPIDGAVLDLQWFGGIEASAETTAMGGLRWDTRQFPDPANKLASYAASGLGIMSIEESYIGAAQPDHATLAQQRGLAMACPPPCTTASYLDTNPWWGVGGMVDWSNPTASRWWHDHKRAPLIDDGILGHWTDLGEPEAYDANAYYAGFDWYGRRVNRHRDIHNLYNFYWSQSIAENTARTHANRRPWILSRSGTAGSQRFGVAMWSGDVASSFATLVAQMPAQANMSLSGFDYYGSDVGGFHRQGLSGAALDTLYSRWFANSSLLEIPLRPHVMNLCNCTQTAPDRVGDAASNLANLKLRYRLTPYLYSLAHQAQALGEPIFPPLAYYFQSDRAARANATSKMIGPWLLFTAITGSGNSVSSYLPAGVWTDFRHPARQIASTGQAQSENVVENGLVQAPLFLRQGAIVPMLLEAPNHLGNPRNTGPQWFSNLLIRSQPASTESQFDLVEDDGISRAYTQGQWSRTRITSQRLAAGQFRIRLQPDNRTGVSSQRQLSVEVLSSDALPAQITLNGQALAKVAATGSAVGWFASDGGFTVRLGAHAVEETLELLTQP